MLRSVCFLATVALLVAALACQRGEPRESPPDTADTAGLAAGSTASPAGHDHDPEIPSRRTEIERDAGSRPQQVMDLIGIGPGDRVADVFSGGGYYTYLLSERVGPTGRVYAQGYSPGLAARVDHGDLAGAGNVVLVDSLSGLPGATLDAVLIVRGYHLFEDPSGLMSELRRSLAPGGRVAVVEVRLGQERGHDMETHRMGERTVVEQFGEGGFELAESSDLLHNPDDDHTGFWEERRHLTDRMLLVFAAATGSASTAATGTR